MKLEQKLIDKIEEITLTDYQFKNGETDNGDLIIDDLVMAYEDLLEEFNDFKEYVEDNYSINKN
jgi:hypothetical protein